MQGGELDGGSVGCGTGGNVGLGCTVGVPGTTVGGGLLVAPVGCAFGGNGTVTGLKQGVHCSGEHASDANEFPL